MSTPHCPLDARRTDLSALEDGRHEHRATIVTDPRDYLGGGEDWSDPGQLRAWTEWLDRVHAASCELWEIGVRLGHEAVEAAVRDAGVPDADWDTLPDALEATVAAEEAKQACEHAMRMIGVKLKRTGNTL